MNLIEEEQKKERAQVEYGIKKHIRNWLKRKCVEYGLWGFILNLEPSTDGDKNGFCDLKFEHSDWKKYFSFEAKNLGKTKNISLSKSVDEYVYNEQKNDGGMYRYVTLKYAPDLNFGGMIGFVINNTNESISDFIITKIQTVFNNNSLGCLDGNCIVRNSIFDNPNTFDSIHSIKYENVDKFFRLHHIIMNFIE